MAPFETRKTRIVCISDTHNQTPKLPAGDILIHAGDLTNQGSYSELKKTVEWLEKTDFEAKIVVAGMHAFLPRMHATYIRDGR
jgi:3',5'-cyclic AMP phosphodiesterase CpdA